ncbi:hypothetical protein L1887_08891 [Cichorium endivia]|nr:hypothetical protein L1887_08891 [Cichorium endivia]
MLLICMFDLLSLACSIEFTVKYAGGSKVLLVFNHLDVANKLLMESSSTWKKRYTSLIRWFLEHEIKEGIAWLKVYEMPLHLWDNLSFNLVVVRFGKILIALNIAWDDSDVSMHQICVLVNQAASIDWKLSWISENKITLFE